MTYIAVRLQHAHLFMMTSSNGNIFRVTGHFFLCGEFTGPGEFPVQRWRGALMFPLILAWINGWVTNRGDLRRNRAHYDVIVMFLKHMYSQYTSYSWPGRMEYGMPYVSSKWGLWSMFHFSNRLLRCMQHRVVNGRVLQDPLVSLGSIWHILTHRDIGQWKVKTFALGPAKWFTKML